MAGSTEYNLIKGTCYLLKLPQSYYYYRQLASANFSWLNFIENGNVGTKNRLCVLVEMTKLIQRSNFLSQTEFGDLEWKRLVTTDFCSSNAFRLRSGYLLGEQNFFFNLTWRFSTTFASFVWIRLPSGPSIGKITRSTVPTRAVCWLWVSH